MASNHGIELSYATRLFLALVILPVVASLFPIVGARSLLEGTRTTRSPEKTGPPPDARSGAFGQETMGSISPGFGKPLEEVRALVKSDPSAALQTIERESRSMTGADAEELDWMRVLVLVHLDRIAEARDAAAVFYEEHPGSPWVTDVHSLTGQHLPPKMGPGN